jgi:hypothetical protein
MNKIFKILGVTFILFICVNCSEDFLTTKPTDRISEDYFWTQEKDGILAVNACYPSLGVFRIFSFEGCSENAVACKTWTDSYPIANGSITSSPSAGGGSWPTDLWREAYRGIGRANDVIGNIDKITYQDESLKNRLKGEALFLRAYLYNILINLYGDVPYLDKRVVLIEDSKLPRTSKNDVLANILNDLDMALDYLPLTYDNKNTGRFTKGAAMALKARVYLWQNKFQEARDEAKAVMDLGVYQLFPEYSKLFTYSTENNVEIILDQQFMPTLRTNSAFENLAPRSCQGTSEYVPTRALVDAYENNDPRLNATILLPLEVNPWLDGNVIFDPTPGSKSVDEVSISYYATVTGYHFKKYVLKEDLQYPTRCSINLVYLRYADVLLMFAEAENEINGPTSAAYSAINQVRTRARGLNNSILPDLSGLTKDEFREALHHERNVELAGEGLRYFDLLRWKTAETVLTGTVYGMDFIDPITGSQKTVNAQIRTFNKDRNYLWPIAESELRLNPNLTQNPNY